MPHVETSKPALGARRSSRTRHSSLAVKHGGREAEGHKSQTRSQHRVVGPSLATRNSVFQTALQIPHLAT